jgi:uncharacterized protein (TIGR02171 family)
MDKKQKAGVPIIVAFLLSCSPSLNGPNQSTDLPHPGMKKILSAGKSFQQGWNDTLASLDEKPGMKSSFTYDYWLDTTEVTQKQFLALNGRKAVPDSSNYGVGENYPVYDVSWFDAALFCNARSKAEKLDTVYIYFGVKALPNGIVYELTGLLADLSRDGYRLPTESEWEFAARGGTSALPYSTISDSMLAKADAWYIANSGGKMHPVATKLPNALGLYDIAGNVFEWTNDWKKYYNGKSITNSLGALQPSSQFEKVIKGGAYNYDLLYLRPSHRSATYPTAISAFSEYVGFRCARGIIPNGAYIEVGQSGFIPNPVSVLADGGSLLQFIGTTELKIAFVNVGDGYRTLCIVDFSKSYPFVQEYKDDKNVYWPSISPDGLFVAYCSNNVGLSGPSKITIRSLDSLGSPMVMLSADSAYIPRWWVNPSNGNAYIVYTNSAVMNSSDLWKSTKTYLQQISGGKPLGSPTVLITDGSYHDGLSEDQWYAVTGYDRLMVRNLQTGEEKQQFLSPDNGKDASGSTQVCNVSISPDTGSNVRYMFLDFGYPSTSSLTGCSYQLHQYIFLSSMSGGITKSIRFPANEASWDNPRWTNQQEFGVACGRNAADASHCIYMLDLSSGNYMPIIAGTELQQPNSWIGFLTPNSSHFALDSIGRYNDPSTSDFQQQLASKILLFWKFYDSLDAAVIGSSEATFGINTTLFTGLKAYNLASPGGDLIGQKNIVLNYLLKHCSKLKIVCSSLDPGWLGNQDGNYSWKNGLGQSKGFIYDSCHAFWTDPVSANFREIIGQIPLPLPDDSLNKGFEVMPPNGWGTTSPPCVWPLSWTTDDIYFQQNLQTIAMLSDTLRSKGIHWLMINFPVSPYYKGDTAYGIWGPSWKTAHDIFQKLRGIEATNQFFHFYDANNDGNHDYNDSDAFDESHLSVVGANKMSARVDSVIQVILR